MTKMFYYHLKDDISLSSGFHIFCCITSCWNIGVFLEVLCLFFSSGCFCVLFQAIFPMMWLWVIFFFVFHDWFYRSSWICGLISFIYFGKFSSIIIFSNIMSFLSSLLSFPGTPLAFRKFYHHYVSTTPFFYLFFNQFYINLFSFYLLKP